MALETIKNDLLIIGSGPAGLGAAIYAHRAGIDFSIVDSNLAGGQIVTTGQIDNYLGFYNISGFDLIKDMLSHVKKFGIEIKEFSKINKISAIHNEKTDKNTFVSESEKYKFKTKAIIVATGASPKKLDIPGEDRLIGKGISFCATCDGALYKDMDVAVIGGGNAALEEALFLTKFARKVYIIHRRDELRASKTIADKAKSNKKIHFLLNNKIIEFEGEERLAKVVIQNNKTNILKDINVSAVFEYVGIKPNSALLKDIVELDELGFVVTNKNLETSMPGIFAAGDVRNTPLRQVITAVADGAVAATSAEKYLSEI